MRADEMRAARHTPGLVWTLALLASAASLATGCQEDDCEGGACSPVPIAGGPTEDLGQNSNPPVIVGTRDMGTPTDDMDAGAGDMPGGEGAQLLPDVLSAQRVLTVTASAASGIPQLLALPGGDMILIITPADPDQVATLSLAYSASGWSAERPVLDELGRMANEVVITPQSLREPSALYTRIPEEDVRIMTYNAEVWESGEVLNALGTAPEATTRALAIAPDGTRLVAVARQRAGAPLELAVLRSAGPQGWAEIATHTLDRDGARVRDLFISADHASAAPQVLFSQLNSTSDTNAIVVSWDVVANTTTTLDAVPTSRRRHPQLAPMSGERLLSVFKARESGGATALVSRIRPASVNTWSSPMTLISGVSDHALLTGPDALIYLVALDPEGRLLVQRGDGETWSATRALSLETPGVEGGASSPQMSAAFDAFGALHVVYRTASEQLAHAIYEPEPVPAP